MLRLLVEGCEDFADRAFVAIQVCNFFEEIFQIVVVMGAVVAKNRQALANGFRIEQISHGSNCLLFEVGDRNAFRVFEAIVEGLGEVQVAENFAVAKGDRDNVIFHRSRPRFLGSVAPRPQQVADRVQKALVGRVPQGFHRGERH